MLMASAAIVVVFFASLVLAGAFAVVVVDEVVSHIRIFGDDGVELGEGF